jgi:hypothetical protein
VLTNALVMLTIFYVGAVLATGWAWLRVRRGGVRFSTLRDLTGIGDRAVLRRHFGLAARDGTYRVSMADVLKHRTRAGIILSDLPVHLLLLAALVLALWQGGVAAPSVAAAATTHALLLGTTALSILARSRQPLAG